MVLGPQEGAHESNSQTLSIVEEFVQILERDANPPAVVAAVEPSTIPICERGDGASTSGTVESQTVV